MIFQYSPKYHLLLQLLFWWILKYHSTHGIYPNYMYPWKPCYFLQTFPTFGRPNLQFPNLKLLNLEFSVHGVMNGPSTAMREKKTKFHFISVVFSLIFKLTLKSHYHILKSYKCLKIKKKNAWISFRISLKNLHLPIIQEKDRILSPKHKNYMFNFINPMV